MFHPPFSFPLALDNGFNRLHSGRFRKKISFGARKRIKGPVRYVTSKCIDHMLIAPKKCKRTVFVARPGKCASMCKRILGFTSTITGIIRRCRCQRRAFTISLGFRPRRIDFGTKRVVTLDNGRKCSFKPRLRVRVHYASANRLVSPLRFCASGVGSAAPPHTSVVVLCPRQNTKIIRNSREGGSVSITSLKRPIST